MAIEFIPEVSTVWVCVCAASATEAPLHRYKTISFRKCSAFHFNLHFFLLALMPSTLLGGDDFLVSTLRQQYGHWLVEKSKITTTGW
jgi:hypothetical protein